MNVSPSGHKGRHKRWFAAFLVLSSVLVLGTAYVIWRSGSTNESPVAATVFNSEPGYLGCSDSPQIVEISVRPPHGIWQEWKLRLPKAYLGYSNNWRGGGQRLVRINAKLPSLEPRPTGTFWETCAGDNKQKPLSAWPAELLQINIAGANLPDNEAVGFTGRLEDYVEVKSEVAGLKHLQHRCMTKLPRLPSSSEPSKNCRYEYWYIPLVQDNKQPVVIKCLGVESNPSAFCDAHFSYKGHKVVFTFKRNSLSEWQRFKASVLELLHRFTIGSA